MKQLIFLIFIIILSQPSFAETNQKVLKLKDYIEICIKNNPTIKKILYSSKSEKFTNKKTLSIRDILLELESGYTRKTPIENNDGNSGEKTNNWQITGTLSKKFPSLLGLTATVKVGYEAYSGYNYSSGSNIDEYKPVIGASFSIPLLKNFLGKLDRLDISQIALKNKMVDYLEKESIEEFIKSFYLNYLNWMLMDKKIKIYQEILQEAKELYRQTLRKSRFKIADQADIQLAKQTLLSYQSQLENYKLTYTQYLYKIYNNMGEKIPVNPAQWIPEATKKENELFRVSNNLKNSQLRLDKIARLELLQSRADLNYTKNDLKPELNIVLSAYKSSEGNRFSNSFNYFTENELYAGFELKMPLDNSEKNNAFKANRALYQKKIKEYQELTLELSYINKSTLISKEKMKTILSLKKSQRRASLLRLRLSKKKYSQGRIQLRDLIDARSDYADARISYIETLTSYQKLSLEYAAFRDALYHSVFLKKSAATKKHLPVLKK